MHWNCHVTDTVRCVDATCVCQTLRVECTLSLVTAMSCWLYGVHTVTVTPRILSSVWMLPAFVIPCMWSAHSHCHINWMGTICSCHVCIVHTVTVTSLTLSHVWLLLAFVILYIWSAHCLSHQLAHAAVMLGPWSAHCHCHITDTVTCVAATCICYFPRMECSLSYHCHSSHNSILLCKGHYS